MKNLQQKIIAIYKKRQKAHDELLKCDLELDKILEELVKINVKKKN